MGNINKPIKDLDVTLGEINNGDTAKTYIKKWVSEYIASAGPKQLDMLNAMSGLLKLSKEDAIGIIKDDCESIKVSLNKLIKTVKSSSKQRS